MDHGFRSPTRAFVRGAVRVVVSALVVGLVWYVVLAAGLLAGDFLFRSSSWLRSVGDLPSMVAALCASALVAGLVVAAVGWPPWAGVLLALMVGGAAVALLAFNAGRAADEAGSLVHAAALVVAAPTAAAALAFLVGRRVFRARPKPAGRLAARAAFARKLTWILLFVAAAAVLTALLSALPSARPAARRTACMRNLKAISRALDVYVSAYGTVPMDAQGRPSLVALTRGAGALDPDVLTCPADEREARGGGPRVSYLVYPRLGADTPRDYIIVCDRPGNHDSGGNVLYQSGQVRGSYTSAEAYRAWAQRFAQGDEEAAAHHPAQWDRARAAAQAEGR